MAMMVLRQVYCIASEDVTVAVVLDGLSTACLPNAITSKLCTTGFCETIQAFVAAWKSSCAYAHFQTGW